MTFDGRNAQKDSPRATQIHRVDKSRTGEHFRSALKETKWGLSGPKGDFKIVLDPVL